jgi:hypothetical protein
MREHAANTLLARLYTDPDEGVRVASAGSLYALLGLESVATLLSAAREGGPGLQAWFVAWAAGQGFDTLLVDLYPHAVPEVRRLIVQRLRGQRSGAVLARLSAARASGSPALQELAERLADG